MPLPRQIHATAVSISDKGLLLIGLSGSGKSSLALQMMALGAGLIGDDMIEVTEVSGKLMLSSPVPADAEFGIEARGVGLLAATRAKPAELSAIVDLTYSETVRLPQLRYAKILNVEVPCFQKVETTAFPAMMMQYVSRGLVQYES
ncbi:MAG: serine kinase [Aliishimia sp.]